MFVIFCAHPYTADTKFFIISENKSFSFYLIYLFLFYDFTALIRVLTNCPISLSPWKFLGISESESKRKIAQILTIKNVFILIYAFEQQ